MCEDRGQLVGIGPLLSPCGVLGYSLHQELLPAELAHWPFHLLLAYLFWRVIARCVLNMGGLLLCSFPRNERLYLSQSRRIFIFSLCSQTVVLEVALVERGERGCVDEGQGHQNEGSRWHSNIGLKVWRLIFWYLGQNLVIYLFWFHPIHQCYMGMVTARTSCA